MGVRGTCRLCPLKSTLESDLMLDQSSQPLPQSRASRSFYMFDVFEPAGPLSHLISERLLWDEELCMYRQGGVMCLEMGAFVYKSLQRHSSRPDGVHC